ncbi:unnamed protein product [Arabidopsis lyrata]|uniref:uncharacterized protein LOC9323948 n=1 Tax=Arabidopsis lyrata subsp. lyrata TaxID=81972 RepID=UPI000A29BCCE|nr:uncharacterized protein LOC9323948 [Arabidopsis lyrata subsp. lyrata]XP_020891381.1 uncharacterized protein LOC9323948 [Arabidopsis lyrata subsp. lyrata]CAH8255842.1 unnamed protein product [Arabidopsis lyrata]|eukprot:XP_002887885.2 uncharacterized protein LOC9323948 [Arabidopsis lyrata subsp. lyrata]
MASSSATDSTSVPETTNLQRKSNDVGWEFGMLINPNNLDKMKCKLCGKEFSGGIYRLKQHVARIQGNVAACPNSKKEDQEKCKLAILEAQNKKKRVRMADLETRKMVNVDGKREEDEEVIEVEGMGANKSARMLGPMDRFTSGISPETPKGPILTPQQQHIKNLIAKERLHAAFAELLQAPQEDSQMLVRERFPVPRLVVCDQHGSQARFLLAKLNPSATYNNANEMSTGSDVIFTDDVSLQVFFEHLQKLVVQS